MASETCQQNPNIPSVARAIYSDVLKAWARHGLAWLVAVASIWLFLAPAHALPGESIPTFSAAYNVRYGLLRGTMTLELKRNETGYSYETSLRPAGLVSWFKRGVISERTTLLNIDGAIQPLDYFSRDTIANPIRETTYTFDRQSGRVAGKYKSQQIDAPMKDNGHNRISVHIGLMLALQSDTEVSDYSVFDRGRWKDYEFEVIADQRVKTALGTFDTVEVRYSSPGKDKSWSVHFAPAFDYHPVMLVYRKGGKVKSRAQLTDYRVDQ